MKLHTIETIETTKGAPYVRRMAVSGGWIYWTFEDGDLVSDYVPDPTAPHCRPKVRRFRVSDAVNYETGWTKLAQSYIRKEDRQTLADVRHTDGAVEVFHSFDNSLSQHATIAEAHDALLASGSDSPWVEVTE